jgi:autotransporter-associated beta strand protein
MISRCLLLTAASAALSLPLAAATITFDTPVNIATTNDVTQEGALVYAYNLGNGTVQNRTVNGVTFVGLANTNGNSDLTFSPGLNTGSANEGGTPDVGDAQYQAMITKWLYVGAGKTNSIILKNLTAGQPYLLQYWANDSRADTRKTIVQNALAPFTPVTVDNNTTDLANGKGQYLVGRFTANATTQAFQVVAGTGQLGSFAAIQVRSVAPAALVAFGTPAKVSGPSDVVTDGVLKYAYTLGTSNNIALNGVLFKQEAAFSGDWDGGNATVDFAVLNATRSTGLFPGGFNGGYAKVLEGVVYRATGTPPTATITLKKLTVGHVYKVQLWANDCQLYGANRSVLIESSSGPVTNGVTLDVNDTNAQGGVGEQVTGVLTATTDRVTFNLTGTGSNASKMALISALQLRDLSVSEQTWTGGATGTWDETGAGWDPVTDGDTPWSAANGPTNVATFSTAATVTVSTAVSAYRANVYQPVTLAGPGSLTVSDLLSVGGAAGVLQLGDGVSAGHVFGPILNNGTLRWANPGDETLAATLSGAGAVVKLGAGTLTVPEVFAQYTGATRAEAGTLRYPGNFKSASHLLSPNAVVELSVASGSRDFAATTFSGAGVLRKTGLGTAVWTAAATTFAMEPNALIDVQGGLFIGGSSGNEVWTNNKSGLHVAAGAVFSGVEANVRVDAITGAGLLQSGYNGSGYQRLTIGVAGGSSTFDGVIANGSAPCNLLKIGEGTIILAGTNTYTGTTTISNGTLWLAASLGSTLSTNTAVTLAGGTLSLAGVSQTVASLAVPLASSLAVQAGSELTVNGDVDLSALTLAVNPAGLARGASYPVIRTSGSLTWPFAAVTGLPSDWRVYYETASVPHTVYIQYQRGTTLLVK